jgi:hypothetical protein
MRTNPDGLVQPEGPNLVPDGEYRARLVAVAPFANAHGERMGFSYKIIGGPHAGVILIQSAARSESPKGKLAAILIDLLGREPTLEELINGPGSEHIGLGCRIIVAEGRSRSGTRYSAVQQVRRAKT